MFGIGMGELIVIAALALIIFGPQRLPELASTLGKAIRQFRKATQDLQNQLEIDEEVKQPLRELRAALRDDLMPPVVRPLAPNPPLPPPPAISPPAPSVPPVAAAPASIPVPARPTAPDDSKGKA